MPLVTVVGGGAIGGLLAALLARAGQPVELIVRAGQEGHFREGIHVSGAAGDFRQPVPLRPQPSAGTALIVLTVKLPDLEAVCQRLAEDWRGQAPATATVPSIVLLQNGLDAVAMAARALPRRALLGAVVELGATALTPGEVTYAIPGRLLIGTPEGGETARARAAAALLGRAVPASVIGDLAGAQRLKLLVNLNNGASAATGLTIQQLYARPAGLRLSLGLMREGVAVFAAAGLALECGPRAVGTRLFLKLPDLLALRALRLAGRRRLGLLPVYGSTLQSVMRGRPTEVQALNGAIVRLGQAHGVPTPLNRAVVAAVEARPGSAAARFVAPETLVQSAQER